MLPSSTHLIKWSISIWLRIRSACFNGLLWNYSCAPCISQLARNSPSEDSDERCFPSASSPAEKPRQEGARLQSFYITVQTSINLSRCEFEQKLTPVTNMKGGFTDGSGGTRYLFTWYWEGRSGLQQLHFYQKEGWGESARQKMFMSCMSRKRRCKPSATTDLKTKIIL